MKTTLAVAAMIGATSMTQAATIAVIDDQTGVANAVVFDESTDGDNIGGITGSFSSTQALYPTTGLASYGSNFAHLETANGDSATWTFNNVADGTYNVYASWRTDAVNVVLATNALYKINGGDDIFKDHRAIPDADLVINSINTNGNDVNFALLGQVSVTGGTIEVQLLEHVAQDGAYVYMDSIAIESVAAVPEPSSTALFGIAGVGLLMRRRR